MFGYWKSKYDGLLRCYKELHGIRDTLVSDKTALEKECNNLARDLSDITEAHDDLADKYSQTLAELERASVTNTDLLVQNASLQQNVADLEDDLRVRDMQIEAMSKAETEFKCQIMGLGQECEMLSGSNKHLHEVVDKLHKECKAAVEDYDTITVAAAEFIIKIKGLLECDMC